jgi:uncharacterized damage-inducible protein DinB
MTAIAGVSEQQFKKRPPATPDEPEPWCIAEVLAHLLDTTLLWTSRIEQALAKPESTVTPSDDAQHQEAARAGRLAPVPQLVHGLVGSRREIERLIDRAETETGFERAVTHPTRGRMTVGWMLHAYGIDHETEHTGQIERLREVVGASGANPSP